MIFRDMVLEVVVPSKYSFTKVVFYTEKSVKRYSSEYRLKHIIIDLDGNVRVFDNVYAFKNGTAKVERGGKYNIIDKSGRLLNDKEWFDDVYDFDSGMMDNAAARVMRKGRFNFIDRKGNLISRKWFDSVGVFGRDGFTMVYDKDMIYDEDMIYLMDRNGIFYDMGKKRLPDDMQVNLKKEK